MAMRASHTEGGSGSPTGPVPGGNLGAPAQPAEPAERHGGRILNPATAPLAAGARRPSATTYRANTLLLPGALLRDPAALAAIERALAGVGLTAVIPPPLDTAGAGLRPWLEHLRDLPRAVVLRVREGAPPTVVDAWFALQVLRAAPESDSLPVSGISLDHLLRAGSIAGDPASDGNPAAAGALPSPMFSATSRIPVRLLSGAPHRRALGALPTSRRPVVAVLDTGLRRHPWLGEPDQDPDAFLSTDTALQDAIHAEEEWVRVTGGLDIPVLTGVRDVPDEVSSTVGLLDSDIGHGTFIAGIIRQAAPDARVRMIRVMHGDGVVQESVLLLALGVLAAQVATAQATGSAHTAIDVLSLSLGYFDESPDDAVYTGHLATLVNRLNDLGVAVIASAGNDATVQPAYPAALSVAPKADPELPVVSVGALNPNGTKAMFSNDGPWVTAWADGADVISTYPVDLDGGERPLVAHSPAGSRYARRRETLDPDGFRGGFAVWSGTSFAAPLVAARLLAALLEQAEEHPGDPTYDLAATDRLSARRRIVSALGRISARDHA